MDSKDSEDRALTAKLPSEDQPNENVYRMKATASRLSWPETALIGLLASWAFLCVGARAAYYAASSLPMPIADFVGWLNNISSRAFFRIFAEIPLSVLPAAIFVGLLLFHRRACFGRVDGRWTLVRWWYPIIWADLAWNQIALDFSARVASVAWRTLPVALALAYLAPSGRSSKTVRSVRTAIWIAAVALASLRVHAAIDLLGAAVWGAWALGILLRPADRMFLRDRFLLLVLGVPMIQIATSTEELFALVVLLVAGGVGGYLLFRLRARLRWALLIAAPLLVLVSIAIALSAQRTFFNHGGMKIGDSGAYSFCEMTPRQRVFATVPNCGSTEPSCQQGVIAEFDTQDPSRSQVHPIFDETFFGRLEHIVCIDDTIQVGMCCTNSGVADDEATITWLPDDPEEYERNGPEAQARRLVFDPLHNAIFYVGDHVFRVDRETGASSTVVEERILAAVGQEPSSNKLGIFTIDTESIDPHGNRIFIAELGRGSNVYEVALDSLEVQRTFQLHGGGMPSATVDSELSRLYVIGIFGLEVIDLETGKTIARRRTGTMPRPPVVDRDHDLLYVGTTVGGRIHVYDRRTLDPLGEIPIGLYGRNCLITEDRRWFFSSSGIGIYAWDVPTLAARFAPGRS